MLSHFSPAGLLIIAFLCGMLFATAFFYADHYSASIAKAYRKQRRIRSTAKLIAIAFRD